MEKPDTITAAPAIRLVEKPQSTLSTVVNGLLNGASLGGLGFVAYEFVKHEKKERLKEKPFLIAAGVAGICTAAGAAWGMHEAKQLNDYRTALAKDIETLHAQVDRLDGPGR